MELANAAAEGDRGQRYDLDGLRPTPASEVEPDCKRNPWTVCRCCRLGACFDPDGGRPTKYDQSSRTSLLFFDAYRRGKLSVSVSTVLDAAEIRICHSRDNSRPTKCNSQGSGCPSCNLSAFDDKDICGGPQMKKTWGIDRHTHL